MQVNNLYTKAKFHLPGLFEFVDLYSVFLPIYEQHREYFYEWAVIDSIYGAPADCLWGGGRVGFGDNNPEDVFDLLDAHNISARLTFSNCLINESHLSDKKCNELCRILSKAGNRKNGVIVHSDILLNYLREKYPNLYYISSTTKVITDFDEFIEELHREEYEYVVPDYRLNKKLDKLNKLTQTEKDKVEFLCNECCYIGCIDRASCYENVSRKSLAEDCEDHICTSPYAHEGYRFSRAMSNPTFIGIDDIVNTYLPMGYTNYKIEGRSLGSAVVLEMLLYYLVKPQYHIHVREAVYLDSMLDLF